MDIDKKHILPSAWNMKSVKGSRDCRKRLVQWWQEIKPQEQSDRKSDVDDEELKWHEKLTSVWSPCCPEVSVSMCGSSAGQRSSAGASHESSAALVQRQRQTQSALEWVNTSWSLSICMLCQLGCDVFYRATSPNPRASYSHRWLPISGDSFEKKKLDIFT